MKQATSKLAFALMLLGAMILTACGSKNKIADNGDTTSQTSCTLSSGASVLCRTRSHLLHRALVSNYTANALDIVDAFQNRVTTNFAIPVGPGPTYLQLSVDPDRTLTLVNNSGDGTLSSFNNFDEAVKATIDLGGFTKSFVTSTDNRGFAAVPGHFNGPLTVSGAIVRFNPTDGSLDTAIPFPNVSILALDPAEQHLLAFTDIDDDAHWVDLANPPTKRVLLLPPGTLSRPNAAFFSSTGGKTTAYILSCGGDCGGLDAGGNPAPATVTAIDVTDPAAPAIPVLKQWQVNGARVGLIDLAANKLYVAGSMTTSNDCPFVDVGTAACAANSAGPDVRDGWFTVIDLSDLTPAAPQPTSIRIGNGKKYLIRNINGTFWVASLECGVQSCVSRVVNPTPLGGTVSLLPNGTLPDGTPSPNSKGSATGIALAAITGDVYTIEGRELYIYDQNGNPVKSDSTDINGHADIPGGELFDVVYID